jgi:hypothetical protein
MVKQTASTSHSNVPKDIEEILSNINAKIEVCDHDYSIDYTESCGLIVTPQLVYAMAYISTVPMPSGDKVMKCSKCTGLKWIRNNIT